MNQQTAQIYLADVLESFEIYKKLAEKAFAQISDEEFFRAIAAESNSVAAISKHIAGNLRSRWQDFLTSDGEKSDRHRDSEFVTDADTRESLLEFWEGGWQILSDTLKSLAPADLSKIVKIRGADFTVVRALNRSMMHTASHVGQIVFLCKHLRAAEWRNLSIPRGQSGEFNRFMNDERQETGGNYLDAHSRFVSSVQNS